MFYVVDINSHITWAQTLLWCITILPLYTLFMIWIALTVESFMCLCMDTHNIRETDRLTWKNGIMCVTVIPVEVMLLQTLTFALNTITLMECVDRILFQRDR